MDDRQREQMNAERDQMVQRYVAGKILDGTNAKEIAYGMTDPVEVMSFVPGSGSGDSSSGKREALKSLNTHAQTSTLHPNSADQPNQARRWIFWLTVAIAIGLLYAFK
jgi:hypothetical protein